MADVEIAGDELVVHMRGADRFWALKSQLTIPLANVVGAASETAEARKWFHGIRLGGSHIPGVLSAGRFYSEGKWVFWDVHDPDKAVGIQLKDERYDRLVIEVDDPDTTIAAVNDAVARS